MMMGSSQPEQIWGNAGAALLSLLVAASASTSYVAAAVSGDFRGCIFNLSSDLINVYTVYADETVISDCAYLCRQSGFEWFSISPTKPQQSLLDDPRTAVTCACAQPFDAVNIWVSDSFCEEVACADGSACGGTTDTLSSSLFAVYDVVDRDPSLPDAPLSPAVLAALELANSPSSTTDTFIVSTTSDSSVTDITTTTTSGSIESSTQESSQATSTILTSSSSSAVASTPSKTSAAPSSIVSAGNTSPTLTSTPTTAPPSTSTSSTTLTIVIFAVLIILAGAVIAGIAMARKRSNKDTEKSSLPGSPPPPLPMTGEPPTSSSPANSDTSSSSSSSGVNFSTQPPWPFTTRMMPGKAFGKSNSTSSKASTKDTTTSNAVNGPKKLVVLVDKIPSSPDTGTPQPLLLHFESASESRAGSPVSAIESFEVESSAPPVAPVNDMA